MIRFLGFYFLSVLFSCLLVFLDSILPGSFFSTFIDNHFIETYSCLIGFNIASIIFLIGQLISIEEKFNKNFEHTRNEIKQNSFYLLFSLLISIVALIFRPDITSTSSAEVILIYNIFNIFVFSLFLLSFYSIFEVLRAVFRLGKK
jgi:hypothetical protein